MKTGIAVLLMLLTPALWVSCSPKHNDVRAAFDNYKSALLAQDGARAAESVSSRTIAEYQKYIDWAQSADRQTVQSLSLINRFQVILMRHRIPAEELRQLDGKKAFIYAVDRDWIGKDEVIRTSLGKIDVSDDKATTEVLVGGQKASVRFQFVREAKQWRLDLISIVQNINIALQSLAKQQGVSEDEMLFAMAESVSGKKVPETIWDPVK